LGSGLGRPGLVRRIKAITEKAPLIRDLYHRITSDSGAETPAFLDRLQTETKQLQELLQDSAATHKPVRPDACTAMLQPVWQEMHESYALLHTTMEELLGKTQALQQLMDKREAQEQLLQELREQSTTYQTELEDLAQEPQEGQLTSEVLKHLKQRYQMVQRKLQDLAVSSQSLTTQEPAPRSSFEQYRALFEALRTLKLDNVRLSEELHSQTSRTQWLQQEKARQEDGLERLKRVEDAHQAERRKVKHLQGQLERANAEIQQLKSEVRTVTDEYLKLFEQQRA
jgi:chromosome segregation ATPase